MSGDPLAGKRVLLKDLYFFVFVLTAALASQVRDRSLLLRIFAGAGVSMAVLGLIQFAVGINQWDSHDLSFIYVPESMRNGSPQVLDFLGMIQGRVAGTRSHPITYAETLLLCLAAVVGAWKAFPKQRVYWIFSGILLIAGILLSQSRGPWLVMAAMIFVSVLLVQKRYRWISAVVALLIPVFMLLMSPALRTRVATLNDPTYHSNAERLRMWKTGWELIKQNPLFGVGPGHVKKAALPYETPDDLVGGGWGHLHNTFIHLAAERGIPALLAFLVFMGCFVRSLWQSFRSPDPIQQGLGLAGLLGLMAFLASGLTERAWGDTEIMMMLFFLLGLGVRPRRLGSF